jgi:hypothetical protein
MLAKFWLLKLAVGHQEIEVGGHFTVHLDMKKKKPAMFSMVL